jgi:hypothetical protein
MGNRSDAVLLNNSPMKRLGLTSPMSRTVRRSPLPIYVHRHYPVVKLDEQGNERPATIEAGQPLVIVIFQSQELQHLRQRPLVQGLESRQTSTALLLRDPFNWSASMKAKSREPSVDNNWPKQWREYALEFTRSTQTLPDAVRLNYNRWLEDKEYRAELAGQFGLAESENNLGVVTRHAGGSSFDGLDFKDRAMDMNLTSRWHHYRDDNLYLQALENNRDLVQFGLQIFELPEDLRAFALARLATGGSVPKPA